MDYNDDGQMDLVAGGFGGQSYVSLGSDDGFSPPVTLVDENSNEVALGSHYVYEGEDEGYQTMDPMPFAADATAGAKSDRSESTFAFDCDSDGDLDLLLGASSGRLYVRKNIGTRGEPVYAAVNVELFDTEGDALGTGMSHAIPVVADWDGDGKLDIISSGSDGAVVWFRGVGSDDAAAYEPARELIDNAERTDEGPTRSGQSATVEVCDFDGDGDMDLLVGDYDGHVWLYTRE